MKFKYFTYLFLAIICLNPTKGYSQYIDIRLSFKVVLNPFNGQRPLAINNNQIELAVNLANQKMVEYGRGYKFSIKEIVDVGWQGGINTGPSQWYFTDFFATNGSTQKDLMENEAINDSDYQWSNIAINIYITEGSGIFSGGICSFPSENDEILIITANSTSSVLLHELGHYFGLCHTQGCPCGDCSTCSSPESDEIFDTLEDRECWDQDNISLNKYGIFYFQLTNVQQKLVDDVFYNVMSYHFPTSRLTEGQLDKWADVMDFYSSRVSVRSGDSWFVKTTGGNGDGTANDPFNDIENGVDVSNSLGGDIIYLKEGYHTIPNNNYIIDKPVTLRSTRGGNAIIGD